MGMTFDEGEEEYHSNFLAYNKNGKVIYTQKGGDCYAALWSGINGMDRLEIWFPKHEHEDKYTRDLVNWILNSDTFGVVFLTKDYDEGIKNGFRVDIDQPTNLIFMNLAALRMPWEAGQRHWYSWYYNDFIDDGFTIEQAFFLAINFDKSGDWIEEADYNTNHIPFPHGLPWEQTTLEHFKKQQGSMRNQNACKGVSRCWGGGGYHYASNDASIRLQKAGFGGEGYKVKYTPELIDYLKNNLKR